MHLEILESRQLLSAVPTAVSTGRASLAADVIALRAAAKTFVTDGASNAKAIVADAKVLPKTPANAALLAKYKADGAAIARTLKGDVNALVTAETGKVKVAVTALVTLLRHPLNTADRTAFSNALIAVGTAAEAPLTTLSADLATSQTTVSTDLDELVTANPTDTKLATDVSTAKGEFTTDGTAVKTDAAAVKADLNSLASGLTASA